MGASDLVGSTLGRYRILSRLGQGGMGVVYLAHDEVLKRDVALKVLPEDMGSNEERRQRFLREARSAAGVTHPCIAAIYDVAEEDGRLLLAMELVEGATVRDRLNAVLLPVEEVSRIALDIAKGIARAHEKGLVHRDLKPENVMLTRDGMVKILDFGLAKRVMGVEELSALSTADAPTLQTEAGRVMGTPAYMSPEQASGLPVDLRTDVFALGVMFYEMAAGRRPFQGATVVDILAAIARDVPPPLRDIRPEISPSFERAVHRCLEKRAADRFSTAGELVAALGGTNSTPHAVVASGGALTSLASAPTETSGRATVPELPADRRHTRKLGALVAVGAVVLAAGALGLTMRGVRTTTAPAASASASASVSDAPTAVAITSLPRPRSANALAVAAHEEGIAALRLADWNTAILSFRKALALDPDLVETGVHLVLMSRYMTNEQTVEEFRALYRRVAAARSRLSPRDVAAVEAMDPFLLRDPPDVPAMRARLLEAHRRFPHDAELAFFAAIATDDHEEQLRLANAALALDPGYLDALQSRYRMTDALGRTVESRSDLDRCIEQAPGSQCLGDRVVMNGIAGECAAAEADARAMVVHSAGVPEAYEFLAEVLASREGPDEAVREAIRQESGKYERAIAELREPLGLAHLEVLRGRLAAAERIARALATSVDRASNAPPHEIATVLLVETLRERGAIEEAKAIATKYFERRSMWAKGANLDTATPRLLAFLQEVGSVSRDEVVRRMIEWERTERHRARTDAVSFHALASAVATTPEAARERLEKVPNVLPTLSGTRSAVLNRALLGRGQLLAGDPAAEATLRAVTTSCLALQDPFHWVRAHLWLGQALEAKGDRAGACTSYAVVARLWGGEKTQGPTAKEAARRAKAAGCVGK
jgi:eukaryotic-like serine/threonine-protein kinase